MNEKIAKWGRRVVVVAALLFSFSASADWLWWTVDFTDDWGNEGELQSNPAGVGVEGYDLYLVIENQNTGDWDFTVKGGTLKDDHLLNVETYAVLTQTEVSQFTTSEYVFFVEMVKSTETVYDTRYISDRYSYADLVAAGHVSESLEAFAVPWNPAVGGAWAVPEPSSGMLSLLGIAFLALRRRKKGND